MVSSWVLLHTVDLGPFVDVTGLMLAVPTIVRTTELYFGVTLSLWGTARLWPAMRHSVFCLIVHEILVTRRYATLGHYFRTIVLGALLVRLIMASFRLVILLCRRLVFSMRTCVLVGMRWVITWVVIMDEATIRCGLMLRLKF